MRQPWGGKTWNKCYHFLRPKKEPHHLAPVIFDTAKQHNPHTMSVLVGRKAPYFSEAAVVNGSDIVEDFSLDQFLGNKYVILFFYPRDFTYVCPTEIHAFQEKLGDFDARNCAVVGVSTDTP